MERSWIVQSQDGGVTQKDVVVTGAEKEVRMSGHLFTDSL